MPLASLPDATLVGPLGAVDDSPTRSGKAEGLAARGGPQHACSARPNGGLGSGFVVARWTAALPKAQTRPTRAYEGLDGSGSRGREQPSAEGSQLALLG